MTKKVTPKKSAWKPEFLECLRETANVSRAAAHADVARQTAYKERENSEAFRIQWDDAIEEGTDYLEEEARRRAYEGTLKPLVSAGRHVTDVREYSDTLLIFLLKGRRAEIYGNKVQHQGDPASPLTVNVNHHSDEERREQFASLHEQIEAYRQGHDDASRSEAGEPQPENSA